MRGVAVLAGLVAVRAAAAREALQFLMATWPLRQRFADASIFCRSQSVLYSPRTQRLASRPAILQLRKLAASKTLAVTERAPFPVLLRPIHHYLHAKRIFTITASTSARPRRKKNGCKEGRSSHWLWTWHRPQLRGALVIEGLLRRAGEPHGVEAGDGHHADSQFCRVPV